MLIGVLSDTHGNKWSAQRAAHILSKCDMLIHLGDYVYDVDEIAKIYKGRIISVKGNCDFTNLVPTELTETVEGKKIFITHGHKYGVKYDLNELISVGTEMHADLVLYGHTHVSRIDYENGIYFVNPGSTILSRGGFRSVSLIEIKNGMVNPSILRI